MQIANPIYDCVFKFLMQDKKAASIIVGAITGFEIEDLELRPTELQTSAGSIKDLTVYRLDLAAKVKTDKGSRLVTIEIQKAKLAGDIMRFRRYLGSQYSSTQNYETITFVDDLAQEQQQKRALPIFSIYILGHTLDDLTGIPVIRIKRLYYDNATNEVISQRNDFIESLTHDSAVIQVPELTNRRRDRLERILAIFDQALITKESTHALSFDDQDETLPEELRLLIRRLKMAFETEEVRQTMLLEDELLNELQARDRREKQLMESLQNERRLKEEALLKEQNERRLKEEALDELDRLRQKLKE